MCKIEKPFTEFYQRHGRPVGVVSRCKACVATLDLKRYRYSKAEYAKRSREYRENARQVCLEHYGRQCACCAELHEEFLVFDHINGGGNKHRKANKISNMPVWLKINNFPEGFQTLCENCNGARSRYKVCPHESERLQEKIS
jgi:hypothetical protein